MAAGGVHQDASHHPRRDREEVRAVLPLHLVGGGQPQIDLLDERRGLECVMWAFAAHVSPRQQAQLVMHERHEPIEGGCFAATPCQQQLSR